MEKAQRIFDPRAGLWLLIGANVIAFRPHTFGLELALIGLLLALMIVHRRFAMAIKWAVGYCALVVFQQFILPVSPMIIATSFTIFATYTRRMFPCLMTGALMLACTLPAVAPAGTKEGLSVEGLTCAYRKEPAVFQDLSFSARPGEVVSITGPNGVGKTTLSRCLCGLIREQAGQIQLDGRPLNRKGRQKAAFCVMQDVNHQLFSDSVWGECRMSAPDAPDSTVEEVLDSLHLLPFRERHPMSLSGGQKQRLAVATALLSEKPILIFDEPTSGLDYARMVEVSGVIRNLAQQGRIVLVVTHDREFMQRSCDRVLRL